MSSEATPRDEPFQRLLTETSQGQRAALEQILARTLPALRAYVRLHCGALVRAHESCSDLVQSVCREALQGLSGIEFRGEAAFRHWLCIAALNKIRQRERYWLAERRTPQREATASDPDVDLLASYASVLTPSRHAEHREAVARMEQAFDALPEDYRTVIVLSRIVGLPHAEIAREMKRAEGAVRVLLSRALVKLTSLMEA